MNDNIEKFKKITEKMLELYSIKNKNYGDSFNKTLDEDGLLVSKIRLSDKLNRFNSLIKMESDGTKDESIEDTLLDLANYAIMTMMWMNDAYASSLISIDSKAINTSDSQISTTNDTKFKIGYV